MSGINKLPFVEQTREFTARAGAELHYLKRMAQAGLLRLESPATVAGVASDFIRLGEIGAGLSIPARRCPDRLAVIDDLGEITYREMDESANALAHGLIARGVKPGDGVALLARNHRGFLQAFYACARIGARVIMLNTDFAGPQIREVAAREGARLLIHDDEYTRLVGDWQPELGSIRCYSRNNGEDSIAALIAANPTTKPPRPAKRVSLVILTSGTTGSPKGASRKQPATLAPIGGMISRIPFKAQEVTAIPAPMFHAVGFIHTSLAIGMGSTIVTRRKFNPKAILEAVAKNRATALIAVPVMLARLLDAYDAMEEKPDLSSLRIVFVSGSQLGAELAKRATNTLGPVIYNLYGSTEVAFATTAKPEDIAVNASTVGRVVPGAKVRILDDEGNRVPDGTVGRIFVGNPIPFTGYTGGGGKEVIDGLVSSGDVGHFDENGLLYIDGRDDEMIVSGGENVFPAEIEDLLSGHPEIVEIAAVGVEDEEWGERLRTYVVRNDGSGLDEAGVRNYVKENLARYKVPRDVIFVSELPRNPTGKILKRELSKLSGV